MANTTFRIDSCKSCELCAVVCPRKIIFMEPEKTNARGLHYAAIKEADMEKCTGCAFCATICPDCVIKIEK